MRIAVTIAVRLAVLLLFLAAGCSEERTPAAPGGVHPAGWTDPGAAAFHGTWLSQNGFPLSGCQECHGQDYAGGAVGIGCTQSGCHAESPIGCTTCHGSSGTPRPSTGAHWAHQAYCDTCHRVPDATTEAVESHASADASAIVAFAGAAIADGDGGAAPAWDPGTARCTNTYCHGAASPAWNSGDAIGCDGCHGAPPADHARWSRVASSTATCTTCHPAPSGATHLNGVVDVTVTSCTTCHGSGDHAYPPTSLDGSTDPGSRGVGAHARHLDGTLGDRISEPLPCNDCHAAPTSVLDPGHLDSAGTVVRFPSGGSYDGGAQTCTVWCHFDRTPGPSWTDATGGARACGACHDFPPALTRAGNPHPSVAGDLSACLRCHPFGPSTHVNGVVDFLP
jgi:predicted CxxxxCH...CXXCH cytochrome family protein